MRTYKLIFARNEIMSCEVAADNVVLNELFHYEQMNGNLIYAMVQAQTEANARLIAKSIIREVEKLAESKLNANANTKALGLAGSKHHHKH
jgi:hypothetical protein